MGERGHVAIGDRMLFDLEQCLHHVSSALRHFTFDKPQTNLSVES